MTAAHRTLPFGACLSACFRREGLPDDSPRAVELHRTRREALHEILDGSRGAAVVSSGATDDKEAREYVELIHDFVRWATQPEHIQAASEAATAIGNILATAAVGEVAKEGVKWPFNRLRTKQKEGQIEDVVISTPMMRVDAQRPDAGGRVWVSVQVEGAPFPDFEHGA